MQEGEGTPRPVQALLPLFWAGLHKGWTVGWDGDRVTVSRRGVSQPGGGWGMLLREQSRLGVTALL